LLRGKATKKCEGNTDQERGVGAEHEWF
jgi:hypothetical protein